MQVLNTLLKFIVVFSVKLVIQSLYLNDRAKCLENIAKKAPAHSIQNSDGIDPRIYANAKVLDPS